MIFTKRHNKNAKETAARRKGKPASVCALAGFSYDKTLFGLGLLSLCGSLSSSLGGSLCSLLSSGSSSLPLSHNSEGNLS